MPLLAAAAIGLFVAYTLLHYILFLLATLPRACGATEISAPFSQR